MNHWTEDPELVERFVAGEVADDERRALESHLETCAECRTVVQHERAVRAGVRQFARMEMKDRLRNRLGLTKAGSVPWPHVVSAAAVILVVVGLGLYNRWWIEPEPVVEEPGITAEGPVAEEPLADHRQPPAPSAETSEELEDRSRTARRTERQPAERILLMDEDQVPPMAGVTPSAPVQQEPIVWVVGTVIERQQTDREEARSELEAAAKQVAAPQRFGSNQSDRPSIIVSQQPLSKLPMDQRARDGSVIMATIDQRNDSLQITVYADEGTPPVASLPVDAITDDSLVISVDGLRIGLRIPERFLQRKAEE